MYYIKIKFLTNWGYMSKLQSNKDSAKQTSSTSIEKHFGNGIWGSCSKEVPSHSLSSLGLGLSLQPPIDENDQVISTLGDHTDIAEG